MHSLDQENSPYTSAVLEFVGGGFFSVLRMRDLAETLEMGLGGSLVVKAAALTAVSASSLPGESFVPWYPKKARRARPSV